MSADSLTGKAVSLIDHVAMAAYDASESARWFEQTLGLRQVHDEIVDAAGVRLVWLAPPFHAPGGDAATMQIVQPLRPGPVADHLTDHGEGLHHVCFAVPELATFLAEAGESPEQIFTGGFGQPCAFLQQSPTGCVVELVERTV